VFLGKGLRVFYNFSYNFFSFFFYECDIGFATTLMIDEQHVDLLDAI
jgi:hypothetical protein